MVIGRGKLQKETIMEQLPFFLIGMGSGFTIGIVVGVFVCVKFNIYRHDQ
jgi:hypothetical protein